LEVGFPHAPTPPPLLPVVRVGLTLNIRRMGLWYSYTPGQWQTQQQLVDLHITHYGKLQPRSKNLRWLDLHAATWAQILDHN
jgi:hypothetical protein